MIQSLRVLSIAIAFLFALTGHAAKNSHLLTTIAEKSDWQTTGRYSEVLSLCSAFEKTFPKKVKCITFGKTPELRPMVALVVSNQGLFTPSNSRPAVFIQGGIHAGEIDGKDAGFWLVRDLLTGKTSNELTQALSKFTLVFIPVFNVDGHERFGPNHRPNQNGPREMGWRVTSQNLNLNRDYVKADTPEMQAMLELLQKWDPILYVDLHVTDGADFRHDIAVIVDPAISTPGTPETLRKDGAEFQEEVIKKLTLAGNLPLKFYPSFIEEDDPASGAELGRGPLRLSYYYWGARNRLGVLVETHAWKDYATRVKATRAAVEAMFLQAAKKGTVWLKHAREADQADRAQVAGQVIPLSWSTTKKSESFEFLGYAYERTHSEISGKLFTRYDPATPQLWKIPLFSEVIQDEKATAPRGGYIVSPGYAKDVIPRLKAHGISHWLLLAPKTTEVEIFRAESVTPSKKTSEGRTRLSEISGKWVSETRTLPPGSIFIPIHQNSARFVMQLFEPKAPDALLSWGFFNAAFEQKEYMESYVAEAIAREMLAKDPAIANEFNDRLKKDPAFAADPEKRLEFFYRKHPSWDERMNLYPVFRINSLDLQSISVRGAPHP